MIVKRQEEFLSMQNEQLMQAQRDQMRNHPFPGEHKVPHFYPLPSNYLSQLEMQMQHAPPKKKS